MKDNTQPNFLPLVFIILGSCLLALPGIYGSFFLFVFAFEDGGRLSPSLLLPLPPIIGFSLLFGYIWTVVTKRLVGWLWAVSFFFNLIISIVSLLGIFYYVMETKQFTGYEILFVLFSGWTIFVTVASAYYFRHSRTASRVSLP